MVYGQFQTKASDIINSYSERISWNIIYNLVKSDYAKRIAKNIVKSRKIKFIMTTKELAKLIKNHTKNKFINQK